MSVITQFLPRSAEYQLWNASVTSVEIRILDKGYTHLSELPQPYYSIKELNAKIVTDFWLFILLCVCHLYQNTNL